MDETYVLADTSLAEELEELELTEGAETEHGVVERGYLLDGDLAPRRSVDGGADDSVCALAYDIEDLVLCACDAIHDTVHDPHDARCGKEHAPTLNRTLRGAGCAWEAA